MKSASTCTIVQLRKYMQKCVCTCESMQMYAGAQISKYFHKCASEQVLAQVRKYLHKCVSAQVLAQVRK